jgi:hypothetical protein
MSNAFARKKIEKCLFLYADYKIAIEIGKDYLLPKMVVNYGDTPYESKAVRVLREVTSIVNECDLTPEEKQEFLKKCHDVFKHIEKVPYDSETERYALHRSELEQKLREKETFCDMIDMALEALTDVQREIITYQYLLPLHKRLKPKALEEKLNLSSKALYYEKTKALDTLSRVLFFLPQLIN